MLVYLTQMHAMKVSHPDIREFLLDGNFSAKKGGSSSSFIGADHWTEQENRALKVVGSIKGLTLNKAVLHHFSLVVPELNRICQDILEMNDITKSQHTLHYQLTDAMNMRIFNNVSKLTDELEANDVYFCESDVVYNIMTKTVLGVRAKQDFLSQVQIGYDMYNQFVEE